MRTRARSLALAALAAFAAAAPSAGAATRSTAQLPGAPCSVTAELTTRAQTMTYGGGTSCAGGVGAKTIDVVPQVFNRINGKALWFNISLAGLYQGPVSANPLRLGATRPAVDGHAYRVLVVARVLLPDGRVGSATACAGSDCARFPVLSLQPSFTYAARPASDALIRNVACILGQNGLTFNLVNGSYVLDYGGYSLCTRDAKVTRRELTVCAQVANRVSGKEVWFTIAGSCTSRPHTTTAPLTVHTARTAYLGHAYRVKAVVKVRAPGSAPSTTTLYSGAAAP
ncbi:MAG: hypothetical protein ACXVR1_14470 [Solirubrobacteraceae bacterium]